MDYIIRQAKERELPFIMEIYAGAREFMAGHGNPSQWGNIYPTAEQLSLDIEKEELYVLTDQGNIHGAFAMIPGDDPTYREIYNGAWHYDLPYAAIHRVVADGSGGAFDAIMRYVLAKYDYIRIDTHENNIPMKRVIQRNGFLFCGIILTDDGTPRIAFDLKK